jgi:cyclopropane-fatty-acyl-phospholipid synthase
VAFQSLTNRLVNLQTKLRSKKVAEQHYNLGNDLYRYMLGKSMAYTCAYWKNAKTLDQAQYDKFDLICRKINLKPGERVLDLGCGWGSLAKYMAENYGSKVTAVNISVEQVRYAREICSHLPVEVHLCDYRDANSYNPKNIPFDKVVSIGLCEHVGHKNYRHFLKIARENLKENGLFLLHTIGKNDSSFFVNPWINKYIFPNGMLPSIKLLSGAMEHLFVLEDLHNFGSDYDKTLMAWHKNFNDNWGQLKDKYGQEFFRLWNYYLLSCAGGFRARGMQLWQMVLSPKGLLGGYETVR